MRLNALHLTNFRNHGNLRCGLPEGCVFVSGANGAGKTALVESIFLLLTSRSFRGQNFADIRKKGENFLRVEAAFEGGDFQKAVLYYDTEKKFLVDGTVCDFTLFSRSLPFVCYSPEYESYLSDSHSERRAFLDRMIFYADPSHLQLLRKYNKLLLRKRAELVKEAPDKDLVDVLSEQMLPLSLEVSAKRRWLIEGINARFVKDEAAELFMPDMTLSINVSNPDGRQTAPEISAGRPLYGCHKDLVYIKQEGRVVEKFRSFGQKKSALLFLLYHTACFLQEKRGDDVLILLDDFEAGLDQERRQMLDRLFRSPFQVVMTGLEPKEGMENVYLS